MKDIQRELVQVDFLLYHPFVEFVQYRAVCRTKVVVVPPTVILEVRPRCSFGIREFVDVNLCHTLHLLRHTSDLEMDRLSRGHTLPRRGVIRKAAKSAQNKCLSANFYPQHSYKAGHL